MKSIAVTMNKAESVKNFVEIVNKYPYDIDLRSGRYVVNAKSELGVFSLDFSSNLVLEIYNDSCDDLISELSRYIVS